MTDYLGPLSNTLRRLSGPGYHDHGFGWRAEEVERDLIAQGFEITVKPADPIVWDGTDESFAAIAVALPIGSRVGRSPTNNKLPMHIYLGYGDPVRVPVGWRIQPFSDSFAILPPEVTP